MKVPLSFRHFFLVKYFLSNIAFPKILAAKKNKNIRKAFNYLRLIVLIGWSIYPLGYVFGYLTGGIDSNSLNFIYNFADFVNKIAFGLIIWSAAKQ